MRTQHNAVRRAVLVAALVTGASHFAGLGLAVADCTDSEYGWTVTFGAEGATVGAASVAVDADGNAILTGFFRQTVDFDPGEAVDEHSSNGIKDIFVTKMYADGSYAWTRTIGGEGEDNAKGVAIGPDGSILLTGSFALTVDFDPTEGVDIHTSGSSDPDEGAFFVTKLNADGSYGWTRTLAVSGVWTRTVTVDPDGNVAVCGPFSQSSVDFDATSGQDWHGCASSYTCGFVTKYTADGEYVWTRTFGSQGGPVPLSDVATSADREVVVVGYFKRTVDLDPTDGVDEHTSNAESEDIFVVKLFPDGSYAWARTFGGELDESLPATAVDNDGHIYITGLFEGAADFDPGETEDIHTSNGGHDIFWSKLNPDGSYGYTYTIGGPGEEENPGLAVDAHGNPLLVGLFGGFQPEDPVDFDPTEGADYHVSNGTFDVFVTKLYSYGWYGWTRTFGGSLGENNPDMAVDANDNVFVVGSFGDSQDGGGYPVDFDPTDGEDIHTSAGRLDAYVTKLMAVPIAPWILVSDPSDETIDVLQDLSASGTTPQGFDRARLTFSCRVQDAVTHGPVVASSFEVSDTVGTPPAVLEVLPVEETPNTYDVLFVDPITPGEWTTLIAHVESLDGEPLSPDPGDRIDIGFLPGDVDGGGTSAPMDILDLIDSLNGVVPLPPESTDINRSGVATPADILRLIDLLNGANSTRPWLGVSLPERP